MILRGHRAMRYSSGTAAWMPAHTAGNSVIAAVVKKSNVENVAQVCFLVMRNYFCTRHFRRVSLLCGYIYLVIHKGKVPSEGETPIRRIYNPE